MQKIPSILRDVGLIKVVSEISFWHPKCQFSLPKDGWQTIAFGSVTLKICNSENSFLGPPYMYPYQTWNISPKFKSWSFAEHPNDHLHAPRFSCDSAFGSNFSLKRKMTKTAIFHKRAAWSTQWYDGALDHFI